MIKLKEMNSLGLWDYRFFYFKYRILTVNSVNDSEEDKDRRIAKRVIIYSLVQVLGSALRDPVLIKKEKAEGLISINQAERSTEGLLSKETLSSQRQ